MLNGSAQLQRSKDPLRINGLKLLTVFIILCPNLAQIRNHNKVP